MSNLELTEQLINQVIIQIWPFISDNGFKDSTMGDNAPPDKLYHVRPVMFVKGMALIHLEK